MKQLCFILLFLISGWLPALAQSSTYEVFSVYGDVQVQRKDGWEKVTRRMPLRPADLLNIPNDGRLKILEVETNAIYKIQDEGKKWVFQLIQNAQNKSKQSLLSLTNSFTQRMSSQLESSSRNKTLGAAHRVMAAAHRDPMRKSSFKDSIGSTILYTANLLLETDSLLVGADSLLLETDSLLVASDSIMTNDRVLSFRQIEDSTYTIGMENLSDTVYCVNIVAVNRKTRKCRMLLIPDNDLPYIVLDAHTSIVFDEFLFALDPNDLLFAIFTEEPFDNKQVNAEIKDLDISVGRPLKRMQYNTITDNL